MAQYQHLPIYRVTYELLQQITKVTKDFPRDYKHSLGAKLRKQFAGLLRKHGHRVSHDLTRGIL